MNLTIKKYILTSLLVITFLVMIVFTQPWTVDWQDSDFVWVYVMGISGLLGMIVMTRQVLFGVRPAFGWFMKDLFRINGLHKRLGVGTLMALIFHPLAVVISYSTTWLYVFVPDFSSSFEVWVSLGKIALDLLLVILVTSVIARKLMSYRTWHWLHLLSYPAFIAVWLHGWNAGTMIAMYPAVKRYRIGIGIVLGVATLARIAYQFGFLKHQAKVINHEKITDDVYEISLQLPHGISYTPGQFAYLQIKRGGESHPLTILSYESEKKVIIFAYKVVGRFTSLLAEHAEKGVGKMMYIDGPYGVFTSEVAHEDVPVVCIASGIGITPFYELIRNYGSTRTLKLFYLNQTRENTSYKQDIDAQLCHECIHVLSREQAALAENEIVGTRLSKEILEKEIGDIIGNARFYICGGGGVIMSVRDMLVSLGVSPKRIDREPFAL